MVGALPLQGTINQLMESVLAKACCIDGTMGDATPFSESSINIAEQLCDKLGKCGYERTGKEVMYNGFTGEPLEAEIMIGPVYYQRLKHMVKDKIHCLDIEKTEVLTRNGWKNADDLCMNDEIATLKEGVLVYEKPIDIMIYHDHVGNMYKVKTKYIDLYVTAEHRMWVKDGHLDDISDSYNISDSDDSFESSNSDDYDNNYNIKYKNKNNYNVCKIDYKYDNTFNYGFAKAKDIIGKYVKYKTDAEFSEEDYKIFEKERVERGKYKNEDEWLKNFGGWYLSRITNEKDELPSWISKLSRRQVEILLYSMIGYRNTNKYYTKSQKLAGQFQQLLLHLGCSGIIISKNGLYIVEVGPSQPCVNTKIDSTIIERIDRDVKCPVFCLQVPSEVFYIRRNGKCVWTGNSRSTGHVTSLLRQPLNLWVVKGKQKIYLVMYITIHCEMAYNVGNTLKSKILLSIWKHILKPRIIP